MTWSGDISGVGKLADRVADLARVPSRVAARVSGEIATLLDEEFSSGTDPYGTAWQQLAESTVARGRTAPPLTDTGAMRSGVRVAPMRAAGVAITVPHPGAPHQTGWSGPQGHGQARPILPARGALPDAWEAVIDEACEQEFRRAI
jgi:hypothetical protein